jgi:hypothetical protein
MDDRSIDLFDIEQPDSKYGTTHVHAYLRGSSDKTYTVYVGRYRYLGDGVRGYSLATSCGREIERFGRFSAKRLAELAAEPRTLNIARNLAGLE